MLRRVLALDVATNTGWTVDSAAHPTRPIIGSFNCGSDADGGRGSAAYRYEHWLNGVIERYRPAVLAYEGALPQKRGDPSINSMVTNAKLLGLIFVTEMLGYTHGLRIEPCNLQQVRRHFTGSGWADKATVYARCQQLGWNAPDLDASDSAAVWDFMKGKLRKEQVYARAS